MIVHPRSRKAYAAAALALAVSLGVADHAEARRGGSFGSRGMRTYAPPRSTYTTPSYTAPISRSMTPNTGGYGQAGYGQRYGQAGYGRPGYANGGGFFRRWGGPLLGGLALGGLFGMMMGHGFGGGAGFLGLLLQLAILFFVVRFVMGLFRRRREGGLATAGGPMPRDGYGGPQAGPAATGYDQGGFLGGGGYGAGPQPGPQPGYAGAPQAGAPDEIGLTQADYDQFEHLLQQVQGAFGREDYGALRQVTTPEIMSYLSEELSQNAVAGRRNEVRDIRLLQGDLSEAWREGDNEYATVAMRYQSVDIMRDRTSGAVLKGDDRPTETTELWTFVRQRGLPWRLSAIQDAAGQG